MNVFDFAINLERSGRKFYRELAGKVDFEGARTIFGMLAADEEELMRKFQAMKAAVQTTTMEDSRTLEGVENIFEMLRRHGEGINLESDLEAYQFALEVEKEICDLYEEAAERETNDEVRILLRKIAAEERRELENLRKVFDFVNAPNQYLAWGEFSNLKEFCNFGRCEG